MNKKPVLLRLIFAIMVIGVFLYTIFPLTPKDFYKTMEKLVPEDKKDEKLTALISEAKAITDKNPDKYPSTVILDLAAKKGINLKKYISGKDIIHPGDVVSKVKQAAAPSIRLGIDLAGGMDLILKLVPEKDEKGNDKKISDRDKDIAIEIIRNRLETEKIFESELAQAGDYISLKVPVRTHEEKKKIINIIEKSAKLEFRMVADNNQELLTKYMADPENFSDPDYEKMDCVDIDKDGNVNTYTYFVNRKREMSGKGITDAFPARDPMGQQYISIKFDFKGAKRFGEVTKRNVRRQMGIVLDGKLYSAPTIQTAITDGNAMITGSFSTEEAESLSNALKSGSLPVKIKLEGVFDTEPTLGKETVRQGIIAGTIGLIIVVLFMLAYYLRAGVVANIALIANIALVLGSLAAFEATLTLPGIAGIILTIGMAVDANVLIYERIREELKAGRTLMNAIDAGYSRAFTTILDANLTTLFTALILYNVGTGPIKGFAVTLSIGIATSMFTALFLTRLVFDIMSRSYEPYSRKMKMWSLFSATKIEFLGKRYITGTISSILILLTIVFVGMKGKDILGIDFAGGTQITMGYKNQINKDQVVEELEKTGYENSRAVYKANAAEKMLEVIIKEGAGKDGKVNADDVVASLNKGFPEAGFTKGSVRSIGALIGEEFTRTAIWAMVLAIIGIIIYISVRFEFAFACAAIVAIIHDVIIATGLFLFIGQFLGVGELSLPVVAALLTIVGYSLNDTIVVFDRIREDLSVEQGLTYKEIINLSINQTLSRTILTSVTTLLVLVVLMIFGGIAIADFVLVMLIGVIVGTYSSIFVASPIVAVWHKKIEGIKEDEEVVMKKIESNIPDVPEAEV